MEYAYEVWYEGQALVQSSNADEWFESENEADDEARNAITDLLNDWKSEGCWSGEAEEDFDIKIIEREEFE